MYYNGVGFPPVPAPEVSLSVPSGPLHQGTSLTLSCTATLPPSVDTNVSVTIQWTTNTTDNRVTIIPASTLQSPFISILTISPLAEEDDGITYTCTGTINGGTTVMSTDTTTIDVMGESVSQLCCCVDYLYPSFFSSSPPTNSYTISRRCSPCCCRRHIHYAVYSGCGTRSGGRASY